ncbi:MAG: hypothetical protein ACXW5U_07370 [Thermoanaerobaculia bacterium]
MKIVSAAEILERAGIGEPDLHVLRPNYENYRALFMQPHGEIDASPNGVINKDPDSAQQQHRSFLARSSAVDADLVLTPEYSTPWDVLIDVVSANEGPAPGKLWVLGCESLRVAEIEGLQQRFGASAVVIFEAMPQNSVRFVDPLAYVFQGDLIGEGAGTQTIVLIQFKTHPMGDDDHFELKGLEIGTQVYQFGKAGIGIRLSTLLCSDAFALTDNEAKEVYDRGLIIHLQLNPSPRQTQYRAYRDRLFQFQGDATEIICLNWARNVTEWCSEGRKNWNNIAGSAWYLRPDKFDFRDHTIDANHRRGLYYTWLHPQRCNALFLNHEPAVFEFETTKVAHVAVPASVSRRRGPQLVRVYTWDAAKTEWAETSELDDGFSAIVSEAGDAAEELADLERASPSAAERLLALSAGYVEAGENWHDTRILDSFKIDVNEVIFRLTYCQEVDQAAARFKISRLRQLARLRRILINDTGLSPALADLREGFRFTWSSDFPHANVDARAGRATLVYVGEGASRAQADAVFRRLAESLRRTAPQGRDRSARQRLSVWFEDGGVLCRFDGSRYTQIDEADSESEFDIAR